MDWLNRQVYRMFGIWIVLGGNIIDYANSAGFFYGITYIKMFAPIFKFEYISLPSISAQLVGANYAQPGLLAEGYANFGVFGAIINMITILIISEICFKRFFIKQNMFNLLIVIIPFTSVLLDGGSVNSTIFNIIIIIITFSLDFITTKK